MYKEIKQLVYIFIYMKIGDFFINLINDFFGIARTTYGLLAFLIFFIFWYGFFELVKK